MTSFIFPRETEDNEENVATKLENFYWNYICQVYRRYQIEMDKQKIYRNATVDKMMD